jgi:hypothetical protein
MFFARGSYWLFHDAAWYHSGTIAGPWVQIERPPVPVIQIDQPYAYTRYRLDHPVDQTASAAEPAQPQQQAQPLGTQRKRMMSLGP